jgi:hypothetical protein
MKGSVLDIKFVSHSSVQLATRIFCAPINTWRVAFCLRAETHTDLLVKCPLPLSECLRNWTVYTFLFRFRNSTFLSNLFLCFYLLLANRQVSVLKLIAVTLQHFAANALKEESDIVLLHTVCVFFLTQTELNKWHNIT